MTKLKLNNSGIVSVLYEQVGAETMPTMQLLVLFNW
jgi:hypothetical protein